MRKYFYDFLLLVVAIIWGSGFVAADIAVEHWSPILITAIRFSIATGVLAILLLRKLKNVFLHWQPGILVGTFLALGFIFQTVALSYTTPAKNAFLTSTNVVITPFLYLIFRRKAVTVRIFLGATLALLGIGILNFDGQSLLIRNIGDMLTLVCALFFALHIYFTGYFLRDRNIDLISLVFLQFFFAAIISWLSALIFEDISIGNFLSAPGYAVLYLGLFSTLLCFFLQNCAQRKVNSNKTAIILSLEALFGTLFSVLLRGEILTQNMLIGFGLLLVAILLVELKNAKQPESERI